MVTAAARAKYPKPICYSPFLKYVFIHIPKCAGSSLHRALGVLHAHRSFQVGKPKYHKHATVCRAEPSLEIIISRRLLCGPPKECLVGDAWALVAISVTLTV
jgi:hypothetical protein